MKERIEKRKHNELQHVMDGYIPHKFKIFSMLLICTSTFPITSSDSTLLFGSVVLLVEACYTMPWQSNCMIELLLFLIRAL